MCHVLFFYPSCLIIKKDVYYKRFYLRETFSADTDKTGTREKPMGQSQKDQLCQSKQSQKSIASDQMRQCV